jgi:hypothetical protein
MKEKKNKMGWRKKVDSRLGGIEEKARELRFKKRVLDDVLSRRKRVSGNNGEGFKTLVIGTLAVASGLTVFFGLNAWNARDVPERAIGFPQENAEVVSYNLGTKGDVIEIFRNDGTIITDSIVNLDESTTYFAREEDGGVLRYCNRPQGQFAPDGEGHTDTYGNTPQNSDYWCAERPGIVTIKSRGNN